MRLDAISDCMIFYIVVKSKITSTSCLTNDVSLITLDISGVNGKSQNLITDTVKSISIAATSSCTTVSYSLMVTPTPSSATLI